MLLMVQLSMDTTQVSGPCHSSKNSGPSAYLCQINCLFPIHIVLGEIHKSPASDQNKNERSILEFQF